MGITNSSEEEYIISSLIQEEDNFFIKEDDQHDEEEKMFKENGLYKEVQIWNSDEDGKAQTHGDFMETGEVESVVNPDIKIKEEIFNDVEIWEENVSFQDPLEDTAIKTEDVDRVPFYENDISEYSSNVEQNFSVSAISNDGTHPAENGEAIQLGLDGDKNCAILKRKFSEVSISSLHLPLSVRKIKKHRLNDLDKHFAAGSGSSFVSETPKEKNFNAFNSNESSSPCPTVQRKQSVLARFKQLFANYRQFRGSERNFSCSQKDNLLEHTRFDHTKLKSLAFTQSSRDSAERVSLVIQTLSPQKKLEPMKCNECNYVGFSKCSLSNHSRIHTKKTQHNCSECDGSFDQRSILTHHILTVHRKLKPYICRKCTGNSFDLEIELTNHIISKHLEATIYQCEKCEYFCCDNASFSRHNNIVHEKNVTLKCTHCDAGFDRKADLEKHIRSVHKEALPIQCDQCTFTCGSESSLALHNQVHNNMEVFYCTECSQSFKQKSILKRHIDTVHRKIKPNASSKCDSSFDENKFMCNKCDYSSSERAGLSRHIKMCHDLVKPRRCSKCDNYFDNRIALNNHICLAHRFEKCKECDFSASQRNQLLQHMLQVHDKNKRPLEFICRQCDSGFSQQSSLTYHIEKIHTKIKPFKCSQCDKSFSLKKCLKSHCLSIHAESKPFTCDVCGRGFGIKRALTNHVEVVHKKLKPYKCGECDRRFGQNIHLRYHIGAVHKNLKEENTFKCEECDFSCIMSDKLNSHIQMVHDKMKPFVCKECNSCFGYKNSLTNHILSIHKGERPFKCPKCTYSSCHKKKLKSHVLKFHDDEQGGTI